MKGTNKPKEHMDTQYFLTFTEFFVNQKRINVSEDTVKMASHGCLNFLVRISPYFPFPWGLIFKELPNIKNHY